MNELVSIIIPVYNAEKYLNRCVESLTKQTHGNIEIILIDDGSKDRSLELCKAWQKSDSRVVVYHHENHGVSYTRNVGLSCFKGDYVTFVDADDWVEVDYVEKLLLQIFRNGTSISMCGYVLDDEKGSSREWRRFDDAVISFDEALNPFKVYFLGGVLSKLYAREVICDKEGSILKFDEDIKIAEDRLFWFQAVLKAQRISVSSASLYHYCMNSNGAIMTRKFSANYSDFIARKRIVKLLDGYKELQQMSVVACVNTAWDTLWHAEVTFDDPRVCEVKQYIRENAKCYLASPDIGLKDKVKMLMSYFTITRKMLTLYERYSNWKNQ